MPLSKDMTIDEMVEELMESWKEDGKIGGKYIGEKDDALKVAIAIAYKIKEG